MPEFLLRDNVAVGLVSNKRAAQFSRHLRRCSRSLWISEFRDSQSCDVIVFYLADKRGQWVAVLSSSDVQTVGGVSTSCCVARSVVATAYRELLYSSSHLICKYGQ